MNEPTGTSASCSQWGWELSALFLALVGVVARCLPWRYIFSDGTVVLPGTDPYYHVWRAGYLVADFPVLRVFDPYISFPAGAHIPWPPGFDWLVALPGFLGGGPSAVIGWGAVLMPLLGGLSVYLIYRLGKKLFDPHTGLVAAALLALSNHAMGFTLLGRIDHHALVAPVVLGMYLALLAALSASSHRRMILWCLVCGLLAAVSVGSWIITPPLYFLPVPLTLALSRWSPVSPVVRKVAWYSLVSAAVFVLLAVLWVADLDALPFTLYQPSWFTVLLFGLAALGAIPLLYSWRVFLPVWGGLLATLISLVLFAPGVLAPLREAMEIAAGSDVSYLIAMESSRLYMQGELFTLQYAVTRYTYLIVLAPILLLVYGGGMVRRPVPDPGRILFGVFCTFGLFLVMAQDRFGEFAAPAVALLFAWALVAGARRFVSFYRTAPSRTRARVWAGLLVMALALALYPLATSLVRFTQVDPVDFQRKLLSFGRRLAETLPPVEMHDGIPSYGLLTSWNESHAILHSTGRPVVVSSFATAEALAANRTAFDILLSDDEESAYRKMVDNRIRFVVVAPILSQVNAMAAMAGHSKVYMRENTRDAEEGIQREFVPLTPFAECLHTRMLVSDGSIRKVAGHLQKALAHLRLHMESRDAIGLFDESVQLFKTFEVVAGARIEGVAGAGQRVRLGLDIQTNANRRFTYLRQTWADPEGRFEFVVPYPTGEWGAPTRSIGLYRIDWGAGERNVQVSEEQVHMGATVLVP